MGMNVNLTPQLEDELRRDVREGLASGASETWDASALKQKARARRASKTTAA